MVAGPLQGLFRALNKAAGGSVSESPCRTMRRRSGKETGRAFVSDTGRRGLSPAFEFGTCSNGTFPGKDPQGPPGACQRRFTAVGHFQVPKSKYGTEGAGVQQFGGQTPLILGVQPITWEAFVEERGQIKRETHQFFRQLGGSFRCHVCDATDAEGRCGSASFCAPWARSLHCICSLTMGPALLPA